MPFKNQHPLYSIWQGMRGRCLRPSHPSYKDYGGRGITICSRWDSFHAFVEDMGERPKGYSIDRIDNDKGYSPENCRWATRKQQQRNQRRAVYVKIDGRKYRAIELAEQAGVKADTIIDRANRGLSLVEVLSAEPLRDLSGLALGGKANGQRQKSKTHCPNGHEYLPENLAASKEGWRRCKICHREKERERRKSRQKS